MVTILFRILAIILAALISAASVYACPACEKLQPRIFRGIVHGPGPDSRWDYLIVAAVAALTVAVLFYSVKWLIKPGEKETTHIKHFILNPEVI